MFELFCFVAVLLLVVVAIIGWVNSHHWKTQYLDVLDECQFLDLQNTQLRQQLYAAPEGYKLPFAIIKPASAPVQHCSTAPVPVSDGLVESAVIAAATDNAMLGGLVGGNILGGLLGEMLHDSTDRNVVEAAEDVVAGGETIVRAGDTLELDGVGAAVVSSHDDSSSSRDTDSSYDSGSPYESSSYDSGSSDSGFSSSDW